MKQSHKNLAFIAGILCLLGMFLYVLMERPVPNPPHVIHHH